MTKIDALTKLLRLGALSYAAIREISGWTADEAQHAINSALKDGHIRRLGCPVGSSGAVTYDAAPQEKAGA